MTLVRAWRRQLVRGVVAAAFAPAVLVVALLVLAFSGGFGRLGSLTQAFAGPTAPPTSTVAAGRPLPTSVVAVLASAGRASPTPGPGGRAAPALHRTAVPRTSTSRSSVGPPTARSSVRGGTTHAPRPAPKRPAPPHKPTPVDRIVSAATGVTSKLPPPVGPTATQALQSLGSTVDKILPPSR